MTRIANSAAHRIASIPEVLWRTNDDAGWLLLDEDRFLESQQYFQQAQKQAAHFPAEDSRRGRTLAGLAWSAYRLAQLTNDDADSPGHADAVYQQSMKQCQEAVRLLNLDNASPHDRSYCARAYHLLGLLQIEFCQGSAAEDSLAAAARHYRGAQLDDLYFEVLHLHGKLLQSRRQFVNAGTIFRQIADQATQWERRLAALVDLSNTYVWTGYVREAWQLQPSWRDLERKLNSASDEDPPTNLLFRAGLVFARANLLYGDFDAAETILQRISAELCQCDAVSVMCQTVFNLVSAELALQRGQLTCAHQHLQKITPSQAAGNEPGNSYSCFDVIAIDSACRRCVIQICTCERITRCCVFRRPACRIVFTTTTEIRPTPVEEIVTAFTNALRGQLCFQAGRIAEAATLLADSRTAIEQQIHPQSPLLLHLIGWQAEVAQARMQPREVVEKLLHEAADVAQALQASPQPLEATRDRLLANDLVQQRYYDVASVLYLQSLRHASAYHIAQHPMDDYVLIQSAFADAIAQLKTGAQPTDCPQLCENLEEWWEIIYATLARLEQKLHCDDYRLLSSRTISAWLCFTTSNDTCAERAFRQLEQDWRSRDDRLHTSIPLENASDPIRRDSRQGRAMLGLLAARLQSGTLTCSVRENGGLASKAPDDTFTEYLQFMKVYGGLNESQAALEILCAYDLLCRGHKTAASACFLKQLKSLGVDPDTSAAPVLPVQTTTRSSATSHRAPAHYQRGFPLLRRLRRR